jgi:hypothetical protein
MVELPEIPGVLSSAEVTLTAGHLASLQLPTGMIPWFPGGHCDPWNHIETAMALDVAGHQSEAAHAYRWLAEVQRDDGSWHNYYRCDGSVEETKLDTNVCAYIATGVWHHWLCTRDHDLVSELWPTVQRALDWVLEQRRPDGTILWAVEPEERPWDYALLTGSSSIQLSLRYGAALAELLASPRPDWLVAAERLCAVIRDQPTAFEPKTRWAMDWYYPVLTGALTPPNATARLAKGWEAFVLPERGIRCVSDEPWVTASETAECALAHMAAGQRDRAIELLKWTRLHRCADGGYWTGIVYPDRELFPADERSSYTAAAVLLAADAIAGTTPASHILSVVS